MIAVEIPVRKVHREHVYELPHGHFLLYVEDSLVEKKVIEHLLGRGYLVKELDFPGSDESPFCGYSLLLLVPVHLVEDPCSSFLRPPGRETILRELADAGLLE